MIPISAFTDVSFSGGKAVDTSADGARFVTVADIDGNGIADVLAASETDDQIAWYKNIWDATLSFTKNVITEDPNGNPYDSSNGYADGLQALFAIDLDGDGDLDILSASKQDNRIAWYENNGAAISIFTPHTISTAPKGARAVYAADLDADGDIDVLSAAYDDINFLSYEVAWYENNGAKPPGFTRRVIDDLEARYPEWVYAVDLDEDNDLDVLVADTEYIHCFKNNGAPDPVFTSTTVSPWRDADRSAYPCDLNGDGALDVLAISARYSKVVWYENNQDSPLTFTAHDIATSLSTPRSLYPVDVDGDGDLDFGCVLASNDTLSWYENLGDAASFTPHVISTSVDGAEFVIAEDMDQDGDQDFLCAAYDGNTIWFFENARFQPTPEIEVHRKESIGPEDFFVRITDGGGPIDFHSSLLGGYPYQRYFYVSNRGAPNLTMSNLTVPTGYSIIKQIPATVIRGTTETFIVELRTDAPGTFSGTISFNTNDSDENPFDFTVTGNVLAPEVEVKEGATAISIGSGPIDFGLTPPGTTGPSRTFTVYNSGNTYLRPSNLTVPTGFLVTEALNSLIPLSQSDDFTIQLDSAVAGTYSGTVSFDNNDADENPFWFTVSGQVGAPEMKLYDGLTFIPVGGGPVDFGSVPMGAPTQSKTFTVKNVGTADLKISALGYSGTGRFEYTGVSTNPIVAASEATFNVGMLTETPGIRSATYSLIHNDPDRNPYSFRMTGVVLEPTLTPTPTDSQTPTPSFTVTATPSISPTPTPSNTQTATETPVPPTLTPTVTPTFTATIPSTPTVTATIVDTLTPTLTSTPSATETPVSPTATFSRTPTETATPTAKETTTSSPTAADTSTSTPTLSATPTQTETHSLTPTASEVPTLTPTPTPDFDLCPDGKIDEKDLLILIQRMRSDQFVDFNGDGKADEKDVFLFCLQWGK